MIQRYFTASYKEGGRGPKEFDCWGMTRAARHELYGLPLLPSYGAVDPDNKLELTRAAHHCFNNHIKKASPKPGSIVTCWRGKLCLHIALVVELNGRLGVFEIDKGISPHWQLLSDFESRFLKVEYYDDRDISQYAARPAD